MKIFLLSALLLAAPEVAAGLLHGRNEQALMISKAMANAILSTMNIVKNGVPLCTEQQKLSGGMFSTLDCNSNLDSQRCTSWTSNFTSATSHSGLLVITCSQCIKMDLLAPSLMLSEGLDIQARRTSHDFDKIPNSEEDVKFIITGVDPNKTKFKPAANNANQCNGGDCSVGKKPFVVAGGKLKIEALPQAADFPTWVNLYDIATDSSAEMIESTSYDSHETPPVIDGCDSQGMYISEDLTTPFAPNFVGSLGAKMAYDNSSLLLHNCTSIYHMLQVYLKDIRKCLEVGRTYLLTVRFRLLKPGATLTECAETGKGCFKIMHEWMRQDSSRKMRSIIEERKSHGNQYGEWLTFANEVEFEEDDLNPSNIYQSLRIDGPAPGVDIELDRFELRLPPQTSTYPPVDDVCSDLVAGNNDADAVKYHPFPFRSRDNANVVLAVKYENTTMDPYLAISGRTSPFDRITWDVAAGCLRQDAVYRFHADIRADIRVHGNAVVTPEVWLKGYLDGSQSHRSVGICPPSNGGWVTCDLTLMIPFDAVTGNRYVMYFELDGAPINGYDVKQIFFKFSGSSTGLIVSNTVKDLCGVGSRVLITSHTINYDDEQVRRITGVRNHADPNYVVLELDSTFICPTTMTDNPDYAVEVALLSRNIVFEGAKDDPDELHGAHLIVFHAPLVEQKLEGVEFQNFGQQGNLG